MDLETWLGAGHVMTNKEEKLRAEGVQAKAARQENGEHLLRLEHEACEGKRSLWSDQRRLNASLRSLNLTVQTRWRVSHKVSKILKS